MARIPRDVSLALLVVVLLAPGTALASPGDLDTSFSGDGLSKVRWANAQASQIAVGLGGKVVAAGRVGFYNARAGVAQLNDDGTRDATFDGDGRKEIEGHGLPRSLAVQPDGKILVATSFPSEPLRVIRLLPGGQLDPSFGGGDGVADLGATGYVSGMAIQPDDKIVVVGHEDLTNGFTLARLLPDGELDSDFGDGGIATVEVDGDTLTGDVALLPNGRICVVGRALVGADGTSTVLAQLTEDGHSDPDFGGDGVVIHDAGVDESLLDLVVQPTGKLVAAGQSGRLGDLTLMRLRPSGRLDPHFGGDGVVTVPTRTDDTGLGAAVEGDGHIVVVGGAGDRWLIARFRRDGRPDTAFGTNGRVHIDLGDTGGTAFDVTIDPAGRIVAAGTAQFIVDAHVHFRFLLARLLVS